MTTSFSIEDQIQTSESRASAGKEKFARDVANYEKQIKDKTTSGRWPLKINDFQYADTDGFTGSSTELFERMAFNKALSNVIAASK